MRQATLEQKIATADALTYPQGTEIIKLLANPAVPGYMRTTLARAINSKCSGFKTNQSGVAKAAAQTCQNPENFLPIWVWDLIADKDSTYNKILSALELVFERLGLTSGNEPTYANTIAALLLARLGGDRAFQVSPDDALKMETDLKNLVRKRTKRVKLPHYGRVIAFPEFPDELLKDFPDVYRMVYPDLEANPKNAPMKCPLDAGLLAQLKVRLPMRKTHASLTLGTCLVQGGRMRQPSMVLGGNRRAIASHADTDIDLPGFQWCVPQQRPVRTRCSASRALTDYPYPAPLEFVPPAPYGAPAGPPPASLQFEPPAGFAPPAQLPPGAPATMPPAQSGIHKVAAELQSKVGAVAEVGAKIDKMSEQVRDAVRKRQIKVLCNVCQNRVYLF